MWEGVLGWHGGRARAASLLVRNAQALVRPAARMTIYQRRGPLQLTTLRQQERGQNPLPRVHFMTTVMASSSQRGHIWKRDADARVRSRAPCRHPATETVLVTSSNRGTEMKPCQLCGDMACHPSNRQSQLELLPHQNSETRVLCCVADSVHRC